MPIVCRILALADSHIDDRMTLAGMQPTTASGDPLVLEQGRAMLEWVGQVGRERNVDLFIHLGDLYERPRPSPATEAVAARALVHHTEHAPELLVLGNHDRPIGHGKHALEPLKVLRPDRLLVGDSPCVMELWRTSTGPRLIPADLSGGPVVVQGQGTLQNERLLCAVAVLPYPSRSGLAEGTESKEATNAALTAALDQLLSLLTTLTEPYRAANVPVLLAGHGTLRGAKYDAYQTVPLSDVQIPTESFDRYAAALFGHLHLRQEAPGHGWPHHYVGSPDRQDFGEEASEHGVTILEIEENGRAFVEFVPYPGARRFVTLDAAGVLARSRMLPQADAGGQLDLAAAVQSSDVDPAALLGITLQDPVVLRVKGEVDDDGYRQLALLVRRWRTAGWVAANACTVARAERARVAVENDAPLLVRGTEAVFAARPDLAEHREQIMGHLAVLRPHGLSQSAETAR